MVAGNKMAERCPGDVLWPAPPKWPPLCRSNDSGPPRPPFATVFRRYHFDLSIFNGAHLGSPGFRASFLDSTQLPSFTEFFLVSYVVLPVFSYFYLDFLNSTYII